jgi:hypothetical protein
MILYGRNVLTHITGSGAKQCGYSFYLADTVRKEFFEILETNEFTIWTALGVDVAGALVARNENEPSHGPCRQHSE